MAKMRRNHQRKDRSGFGNMMTRVLVFFVMIVGLFIYLYKFAGKSDVANNQGQRAVDNREYIQGEIPVIPMDGRVYLPSTHKGEVVHHNYYSLSYVEKMEQAEWVVYPLTKKSIQVKNVPRARRFKSDPKVKTGSATHADYKGSLFTRGHMAPAGDMAFNKLAMQETFYMSNMSPQAKDFNAGIWNQLEEQFRDWAYKRGEIIVVTGPVFGKIETWIGKNDVAVPKGFYKIALDNEREEAAGFYIPHRVTKGRINDYQVSIDEIEEMTGIDFFPRMMNEALEKRIEALTDRW